ncbi:hypothetical protein GF312_03825 [Candidatus Poribacteria bacterium]|nr:hypothetical protein [Candidatus Poribacteria bacterium]
MTSTQHAVRTTVQKEEQSLDVRWDIGYIEAEGMAVAPSNAESEAQGKLLAREGAILNARQRLLEEIQGVQIDGVTTMINLMANTTIRGYISGIVKNAHVVSDSENWEDGVYSVKVRIPKTSVASVAYSNYQSKFSMTPVSISNIGYTGLVIDARGIIIKESLMFNVLTDSGILIYGPSKVSFNVVQNNTMATFVSSIEIAQRDTRVSSNPIVIKAVSSRGVDIVISEADGVKIQQAIQKEDFLNSGRVIVVLE